MWREGSNLMKQKENMLQGKLYNPAKSEVLKADRQKALKLMGELSALTYTDNNERERIAKELLGSTGDHVYLEKGFYCDYGQHISVGENFYCNAYCTILDPAPVTIGDNVMFAPHVGIYTATHPVHPENRNSGYEYALPITIGNNVWLGGHVVVNPGVTIGDNVVVGSGSVVTKDLPPDVIAAGNPCKVIRAITEEDRKVYHPGRPFVIEKD